jgi:hypothetical protein
MLWIALTLCGLLLAGLSVALYGPTPHPIRGMAQAIGSAARGHHADADCPDGNASAWPAMSGHLPLLAPLYALWPDPRLLLVIQAALFALGALPVYRLALRRLGNRYAARCLALIYLLYPTALTSVLFDFHGDTLALALLLFALDARDARAWRRYALWVALALCCKLYVAVA